jgi:hypothetical protein
LKSLYIHREAGNKRPMLLRMSPLRNSFGIGSQRFGQEVELRPVPGQSFQNEKYFSLLGEAVRDFSEKLIHFRI